MRNLILSMFFMSCIPCMASFKETCKVEVKTIDIETGQEKLISSNYQEVVFMSGWELNKVGTSNDNFVAVDNDAVYAILNNPNGSFSYILLQTKIQTIFLTESQMKNMDFLGGYNKWETLIYIYRGNLK